MDQSTSKSSEKMENENSLQEERTQLMYRKPGDTEHSDLTHVLDELIVRLDMMEYQMKRCERKINSIYDNLRNDGPLVD